MLAKLRSHRPSPAMLVALIALFVALGGTSYSAITLSKNSVTSRAIGNGQVRRADIANNAVNSGKVAPYSLLRTDFRPGQLPEGAKGDKGDKGDPGATKVVVRAERGFDKVTANCQPGERATGGGAHSVEGIVVGQGPTGDATVFFTPPDQPHFVGYIPTKWSAAAETETGPADVTAWVVCAAP